MSDTRERDLVAELGRSLFDRNLTHGSTGNISMRLDDGWLLTPTNSCLGRLDPERISRLDDGGRLVAGDPPSKELPLHRAVYEERIGARAVIHLHSTYSVALSCLPDIDADNVFPPLTAYSIMKLGRVPLIPYFRPGDERIADAIRAHAAKHCAVLLANHGPVVAGPSLEEAMYAVEELEATARLALLLRGCNARCLTPEQIDELAAVFGLDRR